MKEKGREPPAKVILWKSAKVIVPDIQVGPQQLKEESEPILVRAQITTS